MGERNLREQGETNGFGQLENKVMKTAAQFFGEDLLPYIGVKGKILTVAPTEHVHLEMRRLEEDVNLQCSCNDNRNLYFQYKGPEKGTD